MLCAHLMMIVANKQNYLSATNTLAMLKRTRMRHEAQYLLKFFFLSPHPHVSRECNDVQGCFGKHAHIQSQPLVYYSQSTH